MIVKIIVMNEFVATSTVAVKINSSRNQSSLTEYMTASIKWMSVMGAQCKAYCLDKKSGFPCG